MLSSCDFCDAIARYMVNTGRNVHLSLMVEPKLSIGVPAGSVYLPRMSN